MKKKIFLLVLIALIIVADFRMVRITSDIVFAYDLGELSASLKRLYPDKTDENDAMDYVEDEMGNMYWSVDRNMCVNVSILKNHGKAVYTLAKHNHYDYEGEGDLQKGSDGKWYYKYLGYSQDETTRVINTMYPNVEGTTDFYDSEEGYATKRWIINNLSQNLNSWNRVDENIVEYMLKFAKTRVQDGGSYTDTHDVQVVDVLSDHTLSDHVDDLKKFTTLMTSSSLKHWGSVELWHEYASGSRYHRTVDTEPVKFSSHQLLIEPVEDEFIFAEGEESKLMKVNATIELLEFDPFDGWTLGNYIETGTISIMGHTSEVTVNADSMTATFEIPLNREMFDIGREKDYPIHGAYNFKAFDYFNDDEFSGDGNAVYTVLINPGQIEPTFKILWTNKNGAPDPIDVTNGTIPFENWQDFNITLEPEIDIYGENEVTDVLWSFENTGTNEFRFGNESDTYLNSVEYVMNESKKDTHLVDGVATFTMTTFLKHPIEVDGEEISEIVRTGAVEFIQDEPIPEPEQPVDHPPNAHVKAPRQVRVGDKFKFSGARSIAGSSPIVSYNFTGSGLKTIQMYDEKTGQGTFLSGSSKTLRLEVVDENNLSDTSSTDIELMDPLEADFKVYGDRRIHRIVELDGSSSKDADYYPLEEGGYNWSITPLEGQSSDTVIFLDQNGQKKVRILFLDEGAYNITLNVTANCTYPGSSRSESDSVTHPIVIQPDLSPVANFSATQFVLRDKMDYGQATIELVDTSYSPDNDECIVRWYITKDEDNDGLEGDETYEKIETNDLHAFFKTAEVGNYYAYNEVTEVIPNMDIVGQYLPPDAAQSDHSKDEPLFKRTILVENVAPIVSPTAELKKQVDLLVITDEEGENYTNLISEVNELQKSLYERRIDLNESFVNLKSDGVTKLDVGLMKKQTFEWVRKWFINAEWELYRKYDFSANGTTKDEITRPFVTTLSGGTVDSRTGTVEDMLSFPTYPEAYAEFQRQPRVDDYRTNNGVDIWQIDRLDVDVYNGPNDFLGAYNYNGIGYGNKKAYPVGYVFSDVDFWFRFNSDDYDLRTLTRFDRIEDDPDFPNMLMANILEPKVDSGWLQGAFISEEDDTLSVAMLDAYIEAYRDSENEKYLVLAIANGQNLFLPVDLREKIERYGFKIYFSIDEFWGEYTPNVHKVNNIKFQEGALYAQTIYNNQLKNHSNTPVDKLYYRYQKRHDEYVEYEDQSMLTPVEEKVSGTQGLIRIKRVINIPVSDTGERDGDDDYYYTDPDGETHRLDTEYTWYDGGSPIENLESVDYTNFQIGTEWELDSGLSLGVDKVWSAGRVAFVAQSGDEFFFVANEVNSDTDYGHQSFAQIDVEGIDRVYTIRTVEPIAKWRSGVYVDRDRYSKSDAYVDWSKHDKTNDLYIIKDTSGGFTLCYMDYTYSQPYTRDIRSIRSDIKQLKFSDLEQFAYATTTYSLEQNDFPIGQVYVESAGGNVYQFLEGIPWYIYIPQLPATSGWNNYYIGDQQKYALRELRNDGVQGTVTSWMLADNNGDLYVNGVKEADNAKYPEIDINENEYRYAYVDLDGRVYGKGHSSTGQYGHFGKNESYEEVFNTPYILGPSYTSQDFTSVFDITSKSPSYRAFARGLYSQVMAMIEDEYEDYSETETILIQVGDKVDIGGYILDYEGDPIYETFIDVSHDNTYFDNSDTPWTPPLDYSDPVTVDVPGRMLVGIGAIDNPVGNDERFANFRYRNKDNTLIELLVHRPPVAVIGTVLVPEADGSFSVACTDAGSYDLDHSISRADKGIVESKFYYRKELDPNWTEFDGNMALTSGIEYQFALCVKDPEGAWSEYDIKTIEVNGEPFILTASTSPVYPVAIPAGETLRIDADVFTYKTISSVTVDIAGVSVPLAKHDQSEMTSSYYVEYSLPQSLSDHDPYDILVTAIAVDGSIQTAPLKMKVETPIDLSGQISPQVIEKGDEVTLWAQTSKYASWCYADVFHGTSWTRRYNLRKAGLENDQQSWILDNVLMDEDAEEDEYNVVFKAGTPNGNEESCTDTFTFIPNQPPSVSFVEQSPEFCYEGDDVRLIFLIADPDLGTLSLTTEISEDDGMTWDLAESMPDFEVQSPEGELYDLVIRDVEPKHYKVKVTAIDPNDESGSDVTGFSAADLMVSGQVDHVERWNENRIAFNRSKTGTDNMPRPYNVFWPGELFELSAETTSINVLSQTYCESVTVETIEIIDTELSSNQSHSTQLQGTTVKNAVSPALWEGELWHEDMMKWKTKPLLFRFTAKYSNGTVKIDDVTVQIDNSEDYWRYHRLY